MSVHLPKPIERFLSSENASEAEVLAACFARWHRKRRRPHKGWRTSSRGGAKPLKSTNTRSSHWLWWSGTEKRLSRRKFLEVFPAARSRSTLSSVLRKARLHRWTYSLDGYLELKGKRCLRRRSIGQATYLSNISSGSCPSEARERRHRGRSTAPSGFVLPSHKTVTIFCSGNGLMMVPSMRG